MHTYAVSFTIHYDTDRQRRYDSLMAEIRKCSRVWEETTSFCLVETSETLDVFERRLYLSHFSPTKDKLLVVSVRYDDAKARGAIKLPATLRMLLPSIKIS